MFTLSYSKTNLYNRVERIVQLQFEDKVCGEFSIKGTEGGNGDCFDTGNTCYMEISIEEVYQGQGLARQMIQKMVKQICIDYPQIRSDQMLFIDADASVGFWDRLGMKAHRYDDDHVRYRRVLEGNGYAKGITFYQLSTF